MVVLVTPVELIENLSQPVWQGGVQELDVALRAQVEDVVDAFGQVSFDFWPEGHLQEDAKSR